MGCESEAHAVIADVDVGMVASLLGELADPVDEAQGSNEIPELKGFYELAGDDLPSGEAGQARLSFFRGDWRHGFGLSVWNHY